MGFLEKLKRDNERAHKEEETTCEPDLYESETYIDTDVKFDPADELEEDLYGVFPDYDFE